MNREELLAFLNIMLEAERAGARALLHIARDTPSKDVALLAKELHRDEARWCAMLTTAIRHLDGEPSSKTGDFYDKVMAIAEEGPRLAFVNRGQAWVARKLREALPGVADSRLAKDLAVMLASHEENIAKVEQSHLAG